MLMDKPKEITPALGSACTPQVCGNKVKCISHGPHHEHTYGTISRSAQQELPLAQQSNSSDRSTNEPVGFRETEKGECVAATPRKLEVRRPQRQVRGYLWRIHQKVPSEKELILNTHNTTIALLWYLFPIKIFLCPSLSFPPHPKPEVTATE